MKAVRRIYIYLVAFVSLEVVAWAIIGLGRSALSGESIGGDADQLAGALAFILVGLPIFLIHWRMAQRDAARELEERFSGMRAIFLYGAWLALFVPVVQNIVVIVERLFASLLDADLSRVAIGGDLTLSDNLVGMVVNGVLAYYIFTVIQDNWKETPQGKWFSLIRRIARYLVMLYGYGMLFAGVQQLLSYLFELANTIGGSELEVLVNGLSFTLVGVPLWALAWRVIQRSLDEEVERESQIRMGVLYVVTFLAVVTTLLSGGFVLYEVLRGTLGDTALGRELVNTLGGSLSVMIPALVTWIFYNRVLKQGIEATPDVQYRAGMHRLYAYVLALMGLSAAFMGTFMLIQYLISQVMSPSQVSLQSSGGDQQALAGALATLLIGLPVWVFYWRQMIVEAAQAGEAGDHARRSIIRKGYLYIILFVGVMGIMGATGTLLYNILKVVLGDTVSDFTRLVLDLSSLLALFILLAVYHWRSLRKDNHLAEEALSALHAQFSVVVFDEGEGVFAGSLCEALERECPALPVAVHPVGEAFDETLQSAGAAVIPAGLATDPPEAVRLWLNDFSGAKLFVPTAAESWQWVGFSGDSLEDMAKDAAKMVCRLAEGQGALRSRASSAWTVIGSVFGVLFGIWILCALISAMFELFY